MAENSINRIYSLYKDEFVEGAKHDDFYQYFLNCIKTGKTRAGITRKTIERSLSGEWLPMVEQTIIPIDNIIRNPNRYIKNLEDIVPIEVARSITTESIRHLAQHTSMIAKVDKDGSVTPERILNIIKEESYDTYENRFLYTLLGNLSYFLNKLLNQMHGSKDIQEFSIQGESYIGKEKVAFQMNFSCEGQPPAKKEVSREELINADVSKLTVLQRVERLHKILDSFQGTFLMKALKDCAPVRPPLHMTNVLAKNPNFVKCVELWNFITGYKDEGMDADVHEETLVPEAAFLEDVYSIVPLAYTFLKNGTGMGNAVQVETQHLDNKGIATPEAMRQKIDDFVDSLDLEVDEIKKMFNDAMAKRSRKRMIERNRINNIIKRVLAIEKVWFVKEDTRLKNKAKRLAAEAKAEKERLRKEEKLRKEEEKRLLAEQARLAAEEKARLKQMARLAQQQARLETEARRLTEAEESAEEQAYLVEETRLVAQQALLEEEFRLGAPAIPAEELLEETIENTEETEVVEKAAEEIEALEEPTEETEVIENEITEEIAVGEETPEDIEVPEEETTVEVFETPVEDEAQEEPEEVAPVEEKKPSAVKTAFKKVGGWFKTFGSKFAKKRAVEPPIEETDEAVEATEEIPPVENEIVENIEITEETEVIENEITEEIAVGEEPTEEAFENTVAGGDEQ